jgi:hypothetical protein
MNLDLCDSKGYTIDLSDPNEFTIDGVRRLLASKTGSESLEEYHGRYQLRITNDGIAYIKHNWQFPTDSDLQNHAVLFETWHRSYVGQDAANDDEWVNEVFLMLMRWWDMYSRDGSLRLGDAIYADYLPPALHK